MWNSVARVKIIAPPPAGLHCTMCGCNTTDGKVVRVGESFPPGDGCNTWGETLFIPKGILYLALHYMDLISPHSIDPVLIWDHFYSHSLFGSMLTGHTKL